MQYVKLLKALVRPSWFQVRKLVSTCTFQRLFHFFQNWTQGRVVQILSFSPPSSKTPNESSTRNVSGTPWARTRMKSTAPWVMLLNLLLIIVFIIIVSIIQEFFQIMFFLSFHKFIFYLLVKFCFFTQAVQILVTVSWLQT